MADKLIIKYFIKIFVMANIIPSCVLAKNVVVYNDEGVDQQGLANTINFFKERGDTVITTNATQLTDANFLAKQDYLVIGGGADRFYHKKLNDQAIYNIKTFVKNGGTYIGICAGGYFGCQKVEFALGTELEVNETRKLAFFKGVARGPALKPYVYDSELGASAAAIKSNFDGSIFYAYHNGGAAFYVNNDSSSDAVKVLANYADVPSNNHLAAAIIRVKYGKGQAILSGVHFEWRMNLKDLLIASTNKDELAILKPIQRKIASTLKTKQRFLDIIFNK